MGEPSKQLSESMKRSDTTVTASSSDHSAEDAQPSSPTNPSNPASPETTHVKPGASGGTGRRRKVPDSVTPNACTKCKKARAKCDGAKPSCQRCISRGTPDTCQYEMHAKTAKDQMIQEIQRLRGKVENLEEEKDSLDEKNYWIEQIMSTLKEDGRKDEIVLRLQRGDSHKAIAEWLGRPLVAPADLDGTSPTSTEQRFSKAIEEWDQNVVENNDARYWTNVTQHPLLIEHLINLYLTWIHPSHMVFDERLFMTSFMECSDKHCSHALVSIICAMSCQLLHGIDDNGDETGSGADSLRDRFVEETRGRMRNVDHSKKTTMQTYAVMYLAELGLGHGLTATSYLRWAVEILVERWSSQTADDPELVTTWGVLTLHTAWSGFTYQKPQVPISSPTQPFPSSVLDYADEGWHSYKQLDDNVIPKRPSFSAMTAAQLAKLVLIVQESILVYCGSRGKVTAYHLLDLYERYLIWKDDLPPEIRALDDEPLPHVLLLHIQYHAAVVQLLQPLLHLDHMDEESYRRLQGLVTHHATAGLQFCVRYRHAYSYLYLSPLQLLCMVQLCDAMLRYNGAGDHSHETIHLCLTFLEDAKASYPLARPLEKMFRNSLAEYHITIPEEVEAVVSRSDYLSPEELLEACTRATYRQPMSQILPQVQENAAQEFITRWQHLLARGKLSEERSRASSVTSGSGKRVEIGSLLNP